VIESLQNAWHGFLNLISGIVIPDWGALIGLLPVFLFLGVIMPILTLLVLGWLLYVVRKPRPRVTFAEGPRPAPIGAGGRPVYPTGEPFCTRDLLVYPSGATQCEVCKDPLSVICPKCGVGQAASVTTCGNCGLVLKVANRGRALRPAGPPRGGAALA
jgi:hypothetical protein